MKMKVLVAVALMALTSNAATARDLKIGSECTYPPFNYRTPAGELAGFDIDVAREIGKRLGADLAFVCQPFDSMIPGLTSGKFDLILASLSITEDRKKSIDFSIPYRSSTAQFIAAKGSGLTPVTTDGKPNPSALKGKTVAIQRSSTYERYMKDMYPGVTVQLYDTVDNMLLDLTAKRVDLVFAGPIKLATDFLQKPRGEKYEFVGGEINDIAYFGPGVGVGVRKEDVKLRGEVDAALAAMIKDGAFKAINDKYWSFNVLPEPKS